MTAMKIIPRFRRTAPAVFVSTALAGVLLTATALPVQAQIRPITDTPRILSDKPDRTVIALEYVPASGNLQKAGGLGVYRISEDGPGFYLQFLTDLDQEGPRFAGDPGRFPEPTLRRFKEVTAINLGATSRINGNFSFFGGLGLVSTAQVTEKDDRLGRVTSTGRYYVEDTRNRENRLGVQVGIQYRFQSLVVGSSYNSEIGAPQFSVGLTF